MHSTTMDHREFLARRHFPSLDGLRGLSIIAVVWHHAAAKAYPEFHLAQRGEYGVALFFSISGFLITTLLIREKVQHGDISLRAFYARRALRIFPLYYAVLMLYVALVFLTERGTVVGDQFWQNLPYFASYTNNYFVGSGERVIFYFAWSLAAEEQFYLIWPFLEKRVRRNLCLGLLMVLIFLTIVEREVLLDGLEPKSGWTFIVSRFATPIFLGVIAAHLLNDHYNYVLLRRFLGKPWSAWVVGALCLVALSIALTPMTVIHVLFTCLVIACVMRPSHGLQWLFESRWLMSVGMVSYGVYLLHMLCLNGVRRCFAWASFEQPVLLFVLTLVLAYAMARVSHRYFEAWFMRRKKRFERRVSASG